MTRLRTPPQNIRQHIQQLSQRAEALEQQLIQSQRLATLGTMAMSVAHEFNNLLMTIINQADMALLRDEPDVMRAALQKTMSCGEQASVMIRNMLGHARGGQGSGGDEVQTLRAAEVMQSALELLGRNPIKDGIHVELEFAEGLELRAGKVDMTQVVLNLIINACQAMKSVGGGTLTLRSRMCHGDVLLEVIDTGPGIAEHHLSHIFEPFFTTKGARNGGDAGDTGSTGGTGLGLYLSRKIVEKHGGRINLLTRQGEGTTFQIRMPPA